MAIALLGVTAAAFSPGLHGEFLNWDDDRNFTDNPSYRGLGLQQVRWAWQTYHLGVWQPLSWILLGLQYEIGELDPVIYHRASLALHALNAVVFYWLALMLLRTARSIGNTDFRGRESPSSDCGPDAPTAGLHLCAAAAALLFATHPLRVEAVAWISCQPYLPAALFYMLAVLAYLRGHRQTTTTEHSHGPAPSLRTQAPQTTRWGWLAVALVCYLLAVASKAVAVTLPAVLLILDVYPLRRWGGRRSAAERNSARPRGGSSWVLPGHVWIEKLPFFAVAIVISLWAAAAKDYSQSRVPFSSFDADARLAQAAYGVVYYLHKTVVPTDLIPYCRLPEGLSLSNWRFGLRAAAVVAITIGLIALRRRWPAALAAWAAYVLILLPNLGMVQISQQIAADRYSYLAIMPLMLLLAGGLFGLWQSRRSRRWALRGGLLVGVLAATTGLLFLSRAQTLVWRDSTTLWTETLATDPDCAVAECNLGVALLAASPGGNDDPAPYAEASRHLSRAIDLRPDFAFAYGNLGTVLCRAGRPEDAIFSFERALALGADLAARDLAKIHAGLGEAYAALRQDDLAWKHTRQAQRLGFTEANKMIEYLRKFSKEPSDGE
jgi:tetratricopeptide (TPR) repeat protein